MLSGWREVPARWQSVVTSVMRGANGSADPAPRSRGVFVSLAISCVLVGILGPLMIYRNPCEGPGIERCPEVPIGPDGAAVRDTATFAFQEMSGEGAFTARLTSLPGILTYPPPNHDKIVEGVEDV